MWSFKKLTFDGFFPIYIFTTPKLNRIMYDPIIKIIPIIWATLKYYLRVIMLYILINNRMWLGGMVDLSSRMIGSGTHTNSKKLTLSSRVSFGARSESNPRIKIHILFPSMECDYPKLVIQFQKLWVWE